MKPSKFPAYGDFPETMAFRTYSDWWKRKTLKSANEEFAPHNLPKLVTDDFLVVQFEELVFPLAVRVFETYNPGAVVRIWAYTIADRWVLLWEAVKDEWIEEKHPQRARMFSPQIHKINLPVRTIRLEYNHSKSEYFTEIDAVCLVGRKYNFQQSHYNTKNVLSKRKKMQPYKGPIQKRLELCQFRLSNDQERTIEEFFKYDFNRFVEEVMQEADQESSEIKLTDLPYEVLFKILSYLDLRSLYWVAQVCQTLHQVATDSLLYTEVNLKPYWHLANSGLLQSLTKRGKLMKKFDLSWCGLFNFINANDLKE